MPSSQIERKLAAIMFTDIVGFTKIMGDDETTALTILENQQSLITNELNKIEGVSSVFFGPGFVTVTKDENVQWEVINQNIINIFDKL